MNLYERLGVERDAPHAAIRSAYRARAKALHPDTAGVSDAAEIAAVNHAWHVLGDSERRRCYDQQSGAASAGGTSGDVGSVGDQAEHEPPDSGGVAGPGRVALPRSSRLFAGLVAAAIVMATLGAVLLLLVAMIEGH